jgi:hypothetical protein
MKDKAPWARFSGFGADNLDFVTEEDRREPDEKLDKTSTLIPPGHQVTTV